MLYCFLLKREVTIMGRIDAFAAVMIVTVEISKNSRR